MNIAFFVSNHGYGHLMRELPVITELLRRGHRILLVTAEKHILLAKDYLLEHTYSGELMTVADEVDVGILVVSGSLKADWEAMKKKLPEYISTWPQKQKMAAELFKKYDIEKVYADIVPWAIPAAKEAGIPVILCSNFTWVDQYEGNLSDSITDAYRKCYEAPNKVLFQDLATKRMREQYPDSEDVGFFCRPFHDDKIAAIRSDYDKSLVYISVGGSNSGIDFGIDVSGLPYQFIATSGLKLIGDNVTFLPVETDNTQDYIKAADYCITKAGWGTLAEEMIAGKKVALMERPDVPEDCANIAGLVKRGRAISVSVDELMDIDSVIKKMESLEPFTGYENNYALVADKVEANV